MEATTALTPADLVRVGKGTRWSTFYPGAVTRWEHGSPAAARIDGIAEYLGDPSIDAEGRRRMVQEQCQFLDGRSSERVATYVVETLRESRP